MFPFYDDERGELGPNDIAKITELYGHRERHHERGDRDKKHRDRDDRDRKDRDRKDRDKKDRDREERERKDRDRDERDRKDRDRKDRDKKERERKEREEKEREREERDRREREKERDRRDRDKITSTTTTTTMPPSAVSPPVGPIPIWCEEYDAIMAKEDKLYFFKNESYFVKHISGAITMHRIQDTWPEAPTHVDAVTGWNERILFFKVRKLEVILFLAVFTLFFRTESTGASEQGAKR